MALNLGKVVRYSCRIASEMKLAYSIPSDEKKHVACEGSLEVLAATASEQRRRAVNVRAPRKQRL